MSTEARKRANAKYDLTNTVQIKMKLNRTTDADIIGHLDQIENKQGYIKSLIRQDMKKPVE